MVNRVRCNNFSLAAAAVGDGGVAFYVVCKIQTIFDLSTLAERVNG